MIAQDARKITKAAKASKNEEQYNDIMKEIKDAAGLGEVSITYMYITDVNLRRLKLDGYAITGPVWDKYYIRW